MAFGGYKFKGYKVVRANLATNTYANWCLLIHQARIKAFMESCALSGAQWHFSKTNGALSFESYGNVIYRVANANGDYHDYLSFFKYGDEELYYMIATLGEYYMNNSSGTPVIDPSIKGYQVQGGSASAALYKYIGYSSALSLEPFDDDAPFGSYPASALPCTSQMATGIVNYLTNGVKEGTSLYMISSYTTIYVGYATKGKDIITVTNRNKGCVESGDGFSSLCDPSDVYKLLKVNLGFSTSETTDLLPSATEALDGWNNECLNSNGSRVNINISTDANKYNHLALIPSALPMIESGGQYVPYGSAYLSSISNEGNLVRLNNNKMFVKGIIKNELLSVNCFDDATRSQQPSVGSTVMGGNLLTMLCVQRLPGNSAPNQGRITHGYSIPGTGFQGSSNYTIFYMYPVAYVGWDPSNPNINDESSWPELALS